MEVVVIVMTKTVAQAMQVFLLTIGRGFKIAHERFG